MAKFPRRPKVANIIRFSERRIEELRRNRRFPCVLAVNFSSQGNWRGDLLMIEVHPLHGFTHFVKKKHIKSCIQEVGFYHISVCFTSDLELMRQEHGDAVVEDQIRLLYERFDGLTLDLGIDFNYWDLNSTFGRVEANIATDPSLRWLHDQGVHYGQRPIHVSM